jgi:hypothetical protein
VPETDLVGLVEDLVDRARLRALDAGALERQTQLARRATGSTPKRSTT